MAIASTQRGVALVSGTSANITIDPVNLNKSFVTQGWASGIFTTPAITGSLWEGSARLLNSTTLRIEAKVTFDVPATIAWEVVEFT